LKQGQTKVINGNLLTVPVGGGLLYVQPVYVQSTAETAYPLLQKVLVAFGDQIAFENTLDEALDVLFGGDSGAEAGDTGTDSTVAPETPSVDPNTGTDGGTDTGSDTGTDTGTDGDTGVTTGDPATDAQLQQALNEAKQAIADKQAALEKGDFAAYGAADAKLAEAVARALELTSGK
jgi:uncharacterized membrane protein (UPF0182 family)